MGLRANRKSKNFFVTSSAAMTNNKPNETTVSSSLFTEMSNSFADGEHLTDDGLRETQGAVLYMLQEMSDDIDDLHTQVSASQYAPLDNSQLQATTGSFTNVVATGTVTAEHLSSTDDAEITDNLTVGGDIKVGQNIIHDGDNDTLITFDTDSITFKAGNEQLLKLTEGIQELVTVGDGGDVDFLVKAGSTNTLFVQASSQNIGVGTSTPGEKLEVIGNVSASGFIGGGTQNTGSYDFPGAIMGYNVQGLNVTHATYNLTTTMAVPDAGMYVVFVAPKSGIVEIEVQIYADGGSSGIADLTLGLSDNATYNAVQTYYEQGVLGFPRFDHMQVVHKWVVPSLTAGTTYQYWLGAKSTNTTGTPKLGWGGSTSGRYSDFIMKATALPSNTTIET